MIPFIVLKSRLSGQVIFETIHIDRKSWTGGQTLILRDVA